MLNANNKYNSPKKEDQKLKEKKLFSNRRKELLKQKTVGLLYIVVDLRYNS